MTRLGNLLLEVEILKLLQVKPKIHHPPPPGRLFSPFNIHTQCMNIINAYYSINDAYSLRQ